MKQTKLISSQAKFSPPTRSNRLVMKEYDGSVHREIVTTIKYAFAEGRESYGPMFAFKPHNTLRPVMFQQQITVIHNNTLSATNQIVALREILTKP